MEGAHVKSQNETRILLQPTLDQKFSYRMHCNSISGFVQTILEAYNCHLPLYIDPKVVWITIVNQVCLLMEHHPEELRSKFVTFKGKMQVALTGMSIQTDPTTGRINLDEIAPKLLDVVRDNVLDEKFIDWVCTRFSTTTDDDMTVMQLMMLGSVKHYFNYSVTDCGLPEIIVQGTLEDWCRIKLNLDKLLEFDEILPQYGIDVWYNELKSLVDRFIDVKNNTIDTVFWSNFVDSRTPGSGSTSFWGEFLPLQHFVLKRENNKTVLCRRPDTGMLYLSDIFNETVTFPINSNGLTFHVRVGNISCTQEMSGALKTKPGFDCILKK